MHPDRVRRETTETLTDLPNIGPSMAKTLERIGIRAPQELVGRNALELYEELTQVSGTPHDPCVLDVLMSVVDFMNGSEARVWWQYTPERKRLQSKNSVV